MTAEPTGRVHSVQSLGTVDGPGVRFVVFLQGCPLRCACCHNPDTWDVHGGTEQTPAALLQKIRRCRPYFGADGGVTVSGGEALLQQPFVTALFRLCKAEGIHTCLDTSGCVLNEETDALLAVTDHVLLDIKYPTDADYRRYVGCSLTAPLAFLDALDARGIATWLRQVTIPGKNDTPESMVQLAALARAHPCVQRTELLAFRKLCCEKYTALGIPFPFADIPEPANARMAELRETLDGLLHKSET